MESGGGGCERWRRGEKAAGVLQQCACLRDVLASPRVTSTETEMALRERRFCLTTNFFKSISQSKRRLKANAF